jgi:prepilin peptidase CpaA
MSAPLLAAALSAAAGGVLVAAALHDVGFRTVPNWMPLILVALAGGLRIGQGNLALSAGVGIIVLLAAALCWRRGWLGGGDVKLMAASVMLVPPALCIALVLQVALCGGVLALLYLALSRLVARPSSARPPGWLARIARAERYRMHRRGPLPYASAIAAGALLTLARG